MRQTSLCLIAAVVVVPTTLLATGCTASSGRSGRAATTTAPTTTNREYDTARGVPTTARETGALQGQTTRAATGNVD